LIENGTQKTITETFIRHKAITAIITKQLDQIETTQTQSPLCEAILISAAQQDHEILLDGLKAFNKAKELHLLSLWERRIHKNTLANNIALAQYNIALSHSLLESTDCTIQ